jgi:hypothetical protein
VTASIASIACGSAADQTVSPDGVGASIVNPALVVYITSCRELEPYQAEGR